MVGRDLRCPECSSFPRDIPLDADLDTTAALEWVCEVGHVVVCVVGQEIRVKQRVVGKEKPVDPPKAEVVEAPVEAPVEVEEKRSHHAKAPVVHKKGKR